MLSVKLNIVSSTTYLRHNIQQCIQSVIKLRNVKENVPNVVNWMPTHNELNLLIISFI